MGLFGLGKKTTSICWTKRGCDRKAKARELETKLAHEEKLSKINVDSILANKGVDARNNRISSTWGGISNVTESVGRTVSSFSTTGANQLISNPTNANMITDALTNPQNESNLLRYGLIGIGAILIFKMLK